MNDKLEIMWRTYDTINGLIKFSDTKATALLAINGITLSFIFSLFDKDVLLPKMQLHLAIFLFGLSSGIISIIFCVQCINPIIDRSHPKSLIFFGNIAENFNNCHEYERTIRNEFDENKQLTEITNQVWIVSKIARRKYNAVKRATYLFAAMILSVGVSGILRYLL